MCNRDPLTNRLLQRQFFYICLSVLLIVASIPFQEILVHADEDRPPAPFSIENEEDLVVEQPFTIHINDSEEKNWVLTLPDQLTWEQSNDDEHIEYNEELNQLVFQANQEVRKLTLRAMHSGIYDISVQSITNDEKSLFKNVTVHISEANEQNENENSHDEEADQESDIPTDIDHPEHQENQEESKTDEEQEEASENLGEDKESEPTLDETNDTGGTTDEEKPPVMEETDDDKSVDPVDQPEEPELEEATDRHEDEPQQKSNEQPQQDDVTDDLQSQLNAVKERFTTSSVDLANVSTIPLPPVGGPNVSDLFTYAGDRNVAQHRNSNVRVLADGTRNKSSAMWFNEQIDLNQSFQTTMHLYINGANPNQRQIADGLTFTMHNDPRGLQAIGQRGESLGAYGTLRERSYTGFIQNALSFEFDTYHNGDYSDRGLQNQSHTAVVNPSVIDRGIFGTQNARMVHSNITYRTIINNNWQSFTVKWEKTSNFGGRLSYSFAGQTTTYSIPDYRNVFNNNRVYWGFTGATGEEVGVYAIAYADLPQRPRAEKRVRNLTSGEANFQRDSSAYPGDTLEYEITLQNPAENGLGATWQNVQVEDRLPSGLTYVADGSKDKPTSIDGQKLTFQAGNIGVASSKTLTFRVKVDDRATGPLANQAFAVASSGAFQGQVSTNESSITLKAIQIDGEPVPQTFHAGTDPSTWDLSSFVKNMRITPTRLHQAARVVGLAEALPDVSVPGTYTIGVKIESTTYSGVNKVIQVPITITDGALSFVAPHLDFGTQVVSSSHQQYFGEVVPENKLTITDTRHLKTHWALSVKQKEAFRDRNTGEALSATLLYIENGNQQTIGSNASLVASGRITNGFEDVISDRWTESGNKAGFFLDVSPGKARVDQSYQAELTWTLQDVPANE
ncbi:lectin-like domain-containing protein [Shouchella hunanensis]|uniref:WxL domain-containing protein n=1 Tax=Shouchella hunanensis TaxID=766894 RepID=A0ABY7W361_9BACI|nr:WxL domain-containing protein [Shouchella hunanensis]WDF03392.1 WxL domain-containing protein [Shouchella hunanensis]